MPEVELVLGTKLNSVIPRHLLRQLGQGYTPFMANVKPRFGVVEKRNGDTEVITLANCNLLGTHLTFKFDTGGARHWYLLIFAHYEGDDSVRCFLWDMNYTPTHSDWNPLTVGVTEINVSALSLSYQRSDDSSLAEFDFCDWYDVTQLHCIICTNGVNEPFVIKKADFTAAAISWSDETVSSARFVANRANAVYFSYVDISGAPVAEVGTPNKFRTVWSQTGDLRAFSYANRRQDKPEDDKPINGLITHAGNIYMGKYGGEIFEISAYSRFTNLESTGGFTSQWGQVSAAGDLYYQSDGRVYAKDAGTELTEPIYNLFATDSGANWNRIRATYDKFGRKIYYGTGHRIWAFDVQQGLFHMDDYGSANVKLLHVLPPEMKYVYMWGLVSEHVMPLAEWDITPGVIYQYGKNKIVIRTPGYADNGDEPIQMVYDFPYFGRPDTETTFNALKLIASIGTGPYTLQGLFTDVPEYPSGWQTLGTSSPDSRGLMDFSCFEARARYGTFRVTESSTNPAKLVQAILDSTLEADSIAAEEP